jgi:hypothetical protein
MWKYIGPGVIPGVPPRDMEDEEFEAVCEEYDRGFSDDQKGSLKRSPVYKHVKNAPTTSEAPEEREE